MHEDQGMKQEPRRITGRPRKTNNASPKKVDLERLFEGVAREMREKFRTIKENIEHGPSKGRGAEDVWRQWLRSYLPRRYEVGTGFVTDSEGRQSRQQDIIIFDRHFSPTLYSDSGTDFIPVESVYAVIEVKTTLDDKETTDVKAKIASVRALFRAPSQAVAHAGGNYPPKERGRISGYVTASATSWAASCVWEHLSPSVPADERSFIDGGCVLDTGAFSATLTPDSCVLRRCTSVSQALFAFFGLLFEDLKQLATVPPWDFAHYASSIREVQRPA